MRAMSGPLSLLSLRQASIVVRASMIDAAQLRFRLCAIRRLLSGAYPEPTMSRKVTVKLAKQGDIIGAEWHFVSSETRRKSVCALAEKNLLDEYSRLA